MPLPAGDHHSRLAKLQKIIKVSVVVKSYIFHTIQSSFRYANWNQDSLNLNFFHSFSVTKSYVYTYSDSWQITFYHTACVLPGFNYTPKYTKKGIGNTPIYIRAKLEVSFFPSDGKDSRCATLYLILVIHINPFFNKSPDLLLVACFGRNHEIFAKLHLKCSSSWATASQNLTLS